MTDTGVELTSWLSTLQKAQPLAHELLSRSTEVQQKEGYYHTLREISQQPVTWKKTAELLISNSERLRSCLKGIQQLVLTGSGSSEYVGECVRLELQNRLGVLTTVVGGGMLVEHGRSAIPPQRPTLLVSIARSGDSPESFAALSMFLDSDPDMRHLVLTCNEKGKLAAAVSPRVTVLTLDDATNDRSLVMTSSFSNLVLAAKSLGYLDRLDQFRKTCLSLSDIASYVLSHHFDNIAAVARSRFRRAVFLADAERFGAAREGALKLLEASSGRVATMSETYLGFRHGPMSFAHDDTLIVCFLSSDLTLRGFEVDLLMELDQKGLGLSKLVVGENLPKDILREGDLAVDCPGLSSVGDENSAIVDVLVSQLLAFFRSQHEGLHPDAPSDGVINRVVQGFQMHFPAPSH